MVIDNKKVVIRCFQVLFLNKVYFPPKQKKKRNKKRKTYIHVYDSDIGAISIAPISSIHVLVVFT